MRKTTGDQQFLRVFYGNEDKMEETDIMSFESSKAVATYLRGVAKRIERFKHSKEYRASAVAVLEPKVFGKRRGKR